MNARRLATWHFGRRVAVGTRAMRWTQEELATGLARNAAQRDPSLRREALAGLVGAVMKRIPDQKAYGPLEAERAFEVLRSEQSHRAVVVPMLDDLDRMAKAVAPKPVVHEPAPKPTVKPKGRPVPTAAQLEKYRRDMATVDQIGKQLREARAADRAAAIAKARAQAQENGPAPGPRVIRKTANRIEMIFPRRGNIAKAAGSVPIVGGPGLTLGFSRS